VIATVDWTQLDKAQTSAAAAAADSRMCARIRPNRMKVATSLPMEEELAAIKRKKKVIVQLQRIGVKCYVFVMQVIKKLS